MYITFKKMMKKIVFLFCHVLHFQSIFPFTPTSYSQSLLLHLQKKHGNHKKIGYKKSRQILFHEFGNMIIYGSNKNNTQKEINCEHIWCQKYFKNKEPMKSDLHILYLSNAKLNSHRQDYKFSNLPSNCTYMDIKGNKINMTHYIHHTNIYKKDNKKKIFEPYDKSKGKIARSLAYYYTIYGYSTNFYNNSIENLIDIDDLLKWNKENLPCLDELYRNIIIEKYQDNINPFIKYPVLIELIFQTNIKVSNVFYLGLYSILSGLLSELLHFIMKNNDFHKNKYIKKN